MNFVIRYPVIAAYRPANKLRQGCGIDACEMSPPPAPAPKAAGSKAAGPEGAGSKAVDIAGIDTKPFPLP